MTKYSKKEEEFLESVLSGNVDKKYSPSYSSRLRSRCLRKAIAMGEEILQFHRVYILEFSKIHKYVRHEVDQYDILINKLRNLKRFPGDNRSHNE